MKFNKIWNVTIGFEHDNKTLVVLANSDTNPDKTYECMRIDLFKDNNFVVYPGFVGAKIDGIGSTLLGAMQDLVLIEEMHQVITDCVTYNYSNYWLNELDKYIDDLDALILSGKSTELIELGKQVIFDSIRANHFNHQLLNREKFVWITDLAMSYLDF